jgi:dihydropteroate synthase
MKRPALMGIVNVTPDSFSGDGKLADAALTHTQQLVEAGADILDIGAESTRPNATALSPEEEWGRLGPVLEAIVNAPWRQRVRLSVDTRHHQTAARALALGIDMINDVSGLRDTQMLELLEQYECDIVIMHALGIPVDPKQTLPVDCDVIAEIQHWKHEITARAASHGIGVERLIYDPGVGFGKTPEQSLALILSATELTKTGGRWLFGHSRKSFLKLVSDVDAAARDDVTLAYSTQLAQAGVDYLRVHNVARHTTLLERLCT